MRYLILALLFVLRLPAADSKDKSLSELAEQVRVEVLRRKAQREAEENALRIIREHESGEKKATAEQLAAARAVLQKLAEQQSKVAKTESGISVQLGGADMDTLRQLWWKMFGEVLVVSDRAKSKFVEIRTSGESRQELRKKIVEVLRKSGFTVVEEASATLIDIEPETKNGK